MFSATQLTTAIRNYLLLAAAVAVTSTGLCDAFTVPARIAQQDRLDRYVHYIGVRLAATAQKLAR